jgi:hypothetical protein
MARLYEGAQGAAETRSESDPGGAVVGTDGAIITEGISTLRKF